MKKNIITTLLGIVAGGLIAVQPILVAIQSNGAFIDWKTLGVAFCVGAIGVFAKDYNVTGK